MQPCACCAREKRPIKLHEVHFPNTTDAQCPAWLPFSATEWQEHGAEWLRQVDVLFSTERYLERVFLAGARLSSAELEAAAVRRDSKDTDFESVAAADAWVKLVSIWVVNLRKSLHADSVPAPGMPGHRWL